MSNKLIVCLGEALIDMFNPRRGQALADAKRFNPIPGGAPANVAIGLAKLGMNSAFIGRLGKDVFGFKLEQVLKQNNVDTSQIVFDDDTRTGLAFISMVDENRQDMLFYRNPSADMLLSTADLERDFLSRVSLLHFGSLSLDAQQCREATYRAVEMVRRSNGIISYDVNYRKFLWPDTKVAIERFTDAMKVADIVKMNEIELGLISGMEDIKAGIEEITNKFNACFFLTLGPDGSYFATKSHFIHTPAFKVRTVDATGCGDGFMAGLISSIIRNNIDLSHADTNEIISALKFANAAAALVSTKVGVIPAMPSYSRVIKFLRNYG
ncbi:MAG: carbohydrate kinase [Actinobacteria bacterium]|nr:carbohydrate kinase [Actinomycetota bacterium]